MTQLTGYYLYADYCSGRVGSFKYAGGAATQQVNWPNLTPTDPQIVSFGEDARGELYLMTYGTGTVYRIIPRP